MPVLTVLAPLLGGSTELGPVAAIALLTGAAILFAPPPRSLGRFVNTVLALLFALTLTAFLPATWFGVPEWRGVLVRLGASVPATLSPQPWLSVNAIAYLFLATTWGYYLATIHWSKPARERAVTVFNLGIVGLVILLIGARALAERIPWWPDAAELGFFPNRNQTSDVLGLGGILIYVAGMSAQQKKKQFWWGWFAGLCVVVLALILNYSRAGVVLLLFGIAAWQTWHLVVHRQLRAAAAGFAAIALLVGILFLNGQAVLARFLPADLHLFSPTEDARVAIYRDTLRMISDYPLAGIGLGNFADVFPFYREHSVAPNELIHPESDWLWGTAEMGLLAPVLVLLLFGWWLRKALPFAAGTGRELRVAATICLVGFALHAATDVSAHRLGALWPALFFATIALPPRERSGPRSRLFTSVSRVAGILSLLLGAWWLASAMSLKVPPTALRSAQLIAQAENALHERDFPRVLAAAAEGLRIAPLEPLFYFHRAAAETGAGDTRAAVHDFAIARHLTPHWPEICLEEGAVWMSASQVNNAFDAWEEALARAGDGVAGIYGQILPSLGDSPALFDRWRELGHQFPGCTLAFLHHAGPLEFDIELRRLIAADPELSTFSAPKRKELFAIWVDRGDQAWLAGSLRAHPDWMAVGWPSLARIAAGQGNFEEAYRLVEQFAPPLPSLPSAQRPENLIRAQERFAADAGDLDAGLACYADQLRAGKNDEALVTVKLLIGARARSRWLWRLEAQLWAQKGEWQKAWQSLEQSEVTAR